MNLGQLFRSFNLENVKFNLKVVDVELSFQEVEKMQLGSYILSC